MLLCPGYCDVFEMTCCSSRIVVPEEELERTLADDVEAEPGAVEIAHCESAKVIMLHLCEQLENRGSVSSLVVTNVRQRSRDGQPTGRGRRVVRGRFAEEQMRWSRDAAERRAGERQALRVPGARHERAIEPEERRILAEVTRSASAFTCAFAGPTRRPSTSTSTSTSAVGCRLLRLAPTRHPYAKSSRDHEQRAHEACCGAERADLPTSTRPPKRQTISAREPAAVVSAVVAASGACSASASLIDALRITLDEALFLLERERKASINDALAEQAPLAATTALTTAAGFRCVIVCRFGGLVDVGKVGALGSAAGPRVRAARDPGWISRMDVAWEQVEVSDIQPHSCSCSCSTRSSRRPAKRAGERRSAARDLRENPTFLCSMARS